ncbi:MAG: lytic transglycosylase domain-containing protein, partial [Thermodesulfobacteriota bacterium]
MWKRRWGRATGASLLALGVVALGASRASARPVRFPITVDERFLTSELLLAAYTDPGRTARVFDDGTGCNSLVLFDPSVRAEEGRLRVRSSGEARLGVAAGERCLLPLTWSGLIELVEEPRLDPGAPMVRFVVVDSRLLDADGDEAAVSSTLWGWVKEYVHPRLETRIDLQGPVDELRSLLPAFGLSTRGDTLDRALASLALDAVDVRPGAVEVQVRIDVPEPPRPTEVALAPLASVTGAAPTPSAEAPAPSREAAAGAEPGASPKPASTPEAAASPEAAPSPAPSPAPEPPLSEEELLRWQTALQQWDAFLTFVVKVTGRDAKVVELRKALLEILLDERYALLDALASPAAAKQDPVRPLFLRTWTRLAPVLRQVSDRLPADEALRYLAFVSAGDALQALDQLGPEYGIEISADGLRRLARLVAPTSVEDPLLYGTEVDPQLRELFGFGPPIAPPEENPEVEPTSWWLGSTAWAAEPPDRELLRRLNSWAPTRKDIEEYVPLAHRLLQSVTEGLLASHPVPREHQPVLRALVPATAWKESCWRQFVKRGGKLVPLTSPVGSIGIMQVNVSVWRGFYDLQGLRRDIGYNARAGGEILTRYFLDYALARGEHEKGGGPDALARATYAAYNGGPSQLTRYREA